MSKHKNITMEQTWSRTYHPFHQLVPLKKSSYRTFLHMAKFRTREITGCYNKSSKMCLLSLFIFIGKAGYILKIDGCLQQQKLIFLTYQSCLLVIYKLIGQICRQYYVLDRKMKKCESYYFCCCRCIFNWSPCFAFICYF